MTSTAQRNGVKAWIRRHPLAAYLLVTFSLAWSFWLPLAMLYHGPADLETLIKSPLVVVLQTLGVTAPLISTIIVTRAIGGGPATRRLLHGLTRWRVRPQWYAAACLLVPALTLTGLAIRAALGIEPAIPQPSALADMLADIGWTGALLTLPLQMLGLCFGSPLLEEPGWRGFALPQLQHRIPAAPAAFLVAAIWGLWHLPLFIALQENLALQLTLITLHGFVLGWLYATTNSLLIVILGHASLSVANNSLSLADQGIVQVALTAALCALILAFFRPTDLRPRHRSARRPSDRQASTTDAIHPR
jgi:uncharacterized protein